MVKVLPKHKGVCQKNDPGNIISPAEKTFVFKSFMQKNPTFFYTFSDAEVRCELNIERKDTNTECLYHQKSVSFNDFKNSD